MSVQEWDEVEAENISTAELDSAVQDYVAKREECSELENQLKALKAERAECEAKLLDLLERSKKSKYPVDGLGTAYVINKQSVKTPKDHESKQKLFDYIKDKYDADTLMDYLTVHSARLNSFYNSEAELAAQEGVADFHIPGLEPPTAYTSLGFRKKG